MPYLKRSSSKESLYRNISVFFSLFTLYLQSPLQDELLLRNVEYYDLYVQKTLKEIEIHQQEQKKTLFTKLKSSFKSQLMLGSLPLEEMMRLQYTDTTLTTAFINTQFSQFLSSIHEHFPRHHFILSGTLLIQSVVIHRF